MWFKIGGFALVAGLLGLLIWLYGGSRYNAGKADGTSAERSAWQDKVVAAERDKLAAYQQGVSSVMGADARYIETIREKVVPLTRTIVERSTAYEQTDAGRAICLAPERVLWLDETRSALFDPAPASGSGGVTGSVPADAASDEPRRVDE